MANNSKNAVKKNQAVKMASRKSSKKTSSKASSKSKKDNSSKKKLPSFSFQGNGGIPLKNEIWVVASFGLMILMMLSNFGFCGKVGEILGNFFFGIFGCSQYVMPIAFFAGVSILIANDYSLLAIKKCCSGFILLMMVSAFAQLIQKDNNVSISDLMSIAIKNHRTGGIIGGGFAVLMKDWFGLVGAMVIIFCIVIISLVVLTQKSFISFVKKLTIIAKETAEKRKIRSSMKEENLNPEESFAGDSQKASAEDTAASIKAADDESGKKPKKQTRRGLRKRMSKAEREKEKEEQLRLKQCEEKVKEIEEGPEKQEPEPEDGKLKQNDQDALSAMTGELVFTASEELTKTDSVRELHPKDYPLIVEDEDNGGGQRTLVFHGIDFEEEDLHSKPEIDEEEIKVPSFDELPRTGAGAFSVESREEEPETDEEASEKINEAKSEKTSEKKIQTESEKASEEINEKGSEEEHEKDPEGNKRKRETPEPKDGKEKIDSLTVNSEMIEGKTVKPSEQNLPETEGKKGAEVKKAKNKDYIFPPMSLLTKSDQKLSGNFELELKNTAKKLQETLKSFGVNVTITDISCGPSVTRYEMFPEQGTKVSKIVSLTDDIKLNLAASDIRMEAPIPGKAAIGIEVPNRENITVHFRDIVDNRVFRNFKSKLAFAVGKDIAGKTVVTDLAKMPHLLIAGATGSGKSVCLNTLIMSILYKARPDEVKLIMIDPKMVELNVYNGIPHLLIPVVTDPKKASGALNWAVAEMTNRYSKFTECGVRNIEGYNKKAEELEASGEVEKGSVERMPQIVIIIDELADLMMVAPGEVEDAIVRLSQLARAAGIHLVIATQRPSVNVITGLIKANVPSRIAFAVSSGVDSRTIIDMNGAEKLLGKGDMLFYPSGYQKPVRVQGALVLDQEINDVVDFLKHNEEIAVHDDKKEEEKIEQSIEQSIRTKAIAEERDEYFEAAARFVVEKDKATIGMLQRMFKIGFNRAARIVDQLSAEGIVGPEEGTKPRKVLMSKEQLEQYFEEYL